MSFADACVGEILKGLENSKYKDNTIVVLWSDHGFQLGEKRRWEKYSLWSLATSAPFMVFVPNQKPAITKTQVSYLDLYPTILELLGENKPSYLEGKSFVEVLNNPKSKRTTPAVVTYPKGCHAVIMDNWHYIQYQDGSKELYDNNKDPHQFTNLASDSKYIALMNDLSKHIPK
jgi:arylsulfatase A-like enzyme